LDPESGSSGGTSLKIVRKRQNKERDKIKKKSNTLVQMRINDDKF